MVNIQSLTENIITKHAKGVKNEGLVQKWSFKGNTETAIAFHFNESFQD
jgi:hypothetical protein